MSLHKNVVPALESVPQESIQKHFTKVRHYILTYLQDLETVYEFYKYVATCKDKANEASL